MPCFGKSNFYFLRLRSMINKLICYLRGKDRSDGGHWLFCVTELVSLWKFTLVQRQTGCVCVFVLKRPMIVAVQTLADNKCDWILLICVSNKFTSITLLQTQWTDFFLKLYFEMRAFSSSSGTCNSEPHCSWVQSEHNCYHANMLTITTVLV